MSKNSFAVFAAALLLFASCATIPAQQKAPDWTLNTPKPDAKNTFFVGYASDPNGDVAKATGDAGANMLADIMKYIGVKVSVNSTAEAKATLDSYSANIRSTVTSQSNNRIAGFSIKDKFVVTDKKTKQVIVYVLASYATADLEKEKKRIADLFQESIDAVAIPEAQGRSLIESGRYYEAVRKFVEAVVAASGSDIDNADIKLERNVNNARNALSKLRFDTMGVAGYKALVSQPFAQPFRVKLVAGEGDAAPGVPGAALLVSYQRKQGTRLVSKTDTAMTDQTGLMSYTPPPPDFVGKAKLLVRLDFQSASDLLDRLPAKYEAFRTSLSDEFRSKYVEIGYEISSNAKNVSMAVAIVDLDENGAAVPGGVVQSSLLEALIKQKFIVRGLPFDQSLLAKMDDAAILAALPSGGSFARFAYGAARMDNVRSEGGTFIATAKASVKVVETATGTVLYSSEKASTGLGPDEQSARRAAYRDLGLNALGKDLLASLP